jgi:bifunctional DNA-binding transcriptional regulator/antitoxin component of YhaV-PrlF toxin-antitoxin module
MPNLRELLKISDARLEEINALLADPTNELINELLAVIAEFGGPKEINRKAQEAGKLENLMARLQKTKSPYVEDLNWLIEQRDKCTFISMEDYLTRVLGDKLKDTEINQKNAVTLEISALQYFPWLISEAKRAIEKGELMPGRYIRVRNMAEQEADNGDIMATAAAMRIIGATYVETLDTKGTDGSNIHLGGPETITGYFGGVGQPNAHPIKWVKEYLKFYTTYGMQQALNINPGTVLLGYFLHKLGINNEFKISVFMGNDNPFAILWTLITARLFAREDGTTSLIGFNLSNSVDNETIRQAAKIRKALGLEDVVRLEHHITETWKSIVLQPYNRRDELVQIAKEVSNISAKHEGGEVEIEKDLEHPSDILDYFMAKSDVEKQGLMPALERNYIEKHRSVNLTADALTKARIGVVCATKLHKTS